MKKVTIHNNTSITSFSKYDVYLLNALRGAFREGPHGPKPRVAKFKERQHLKLKMLKNYVNLKFEFMVNFLNHNLNSQFHLSFVTFITVCM